MTILTADKARELIATGRPTGVAATIASGTFQQGYDLPDGSHVDHYLNFGWSDKFIHTPKGYREPESFNYRREIV